jgi:L-seryl-tRNA(Ser) seleniumtransferase
VGTTNRTRLSDYREAIAPETGMVLRVHRSNFRLEGFTASPTLSELAGLCHEQRVPLVEDLGSGLLHPLHGPLADEPTVDQALEVGVAAVTWSGDKLLGGPQAGLVAGLANTVQAMRRNPLYRALRVDKMTLAALDAVLAEYEAERAQQTVPVQRMLAQDAEGLRGRAEAFSGQLERVGSGLHVERIEGRSAVGGGAAPGVPLATTLVAICHETIGAGRLAALLRAADPPVVARVAEQRLLIDLRTVPPEQEAALVSAIGRAAVAETG